MHAQPQPDYPAAHSMDTVWWLATDRDGQVAVFASGEDSPVPHDVYQPTPPPAELAPEQRAAWERGDLDPFGLLQSELQQLVQPQPPVYDLRSGLSPHLEGGLGNLYLPAEPGPVLAVVADLEAVAAELADGTAARQPQVPEGPPWVVLLAPLTRRTGQRLLGGAALGMLPAPGFERGPDGRPSLTALGVYAYYHPGDDTGHAYDPYHRLVGPAVPVHVDQLSPALRALVTRVRFAGLSFTDRPFVQPIPYLACQGWMNSRYDMYLDESFTWRRMPDQVPLHVEAPDPAWRQRQEEEHARQRQRDREANLARLWAWPAAEAADWAVDVRRRAQAARRNFGGGAVRLALTFSGLAEALRALGRLGELRHHRPGLQVPRPALRGPRLVLLDGGGDVGLSPAADALCDWLGCLVEAGQVAGPQLAAGPPAPRPSHAAFQALWDQATALRWRFAWCFNPRLTRARRAALVTKGLTAAPAERWDLAQAMLLHLAQLHLEDYATADGSWDPRTPRWARDGLTRIVPKLAAVPAAGLAWVEQVAAFLPPLGPVQGLRVRCLQLCQPPLPLAEVVNGLDAILEGADADPPDAELRAVLGQIRDAGLPPIPAVQRQQAALEAWNPEWAEG
jgi:hypothetical protein